MVYEYINENFDWHLEIDQELDQALQALQTQYWSTIINCMNNHMFSLSNNLFCGCYYLATFVPALFKLPFASALNSKSPQFVWDGGVPNGGNFLTNLPNWERESQEKVEQPIQKELIFNLHQACLSSVILISLKSVKSHIHSEIII